MRYNSTLASSSAVNAAKKIPTRYRELYDALQNLQKKAPAQVNQSRLQLALAGLETDRPVTRVAILGINKSSTARQVVRLLLADSLEQEANWERQLIVDDERDTGGILIRYGEPTSPSLQPSRTAIPTVSIPAPILREHHIEILISSVFTPGSIDPSSTVESDSFLTPFAGTPTSASGRQTIVSFPVHKTLILANGLDEFQSMSQLLALTSYKAVSERSLVDSMVHLPGTASTVKGDKITVLDISRVGGDLEAMRKSLEHATAFEVSWSGSGLPKLGKWLIDSASTDGQTSKTLLQVIESILDAATINLEQQAAQALAEEKAGMVSAKTRAELQTAIDAFLAQAHLELQTALARGFESTTWRKLVWYKLFYRVDDVPLIVTDLTQRYWLRESSLVVFELLGRLHQAGLINFVSYDGRLLEFATTDGNDVPPSLKPSVPSSSTDYLEVPDQPTLESSELTRARQGFLSTAIPTMAATAQSSLFKAVGFSATTTALSALTYVSTLTPSLYECGTIFALGVVFSLRRLQKQWETCRENFKRDIFAVGRDALKSTEDFMRLAVQEGGRKPSDPVDAEVRKEAQMAVDRAKKALEAATK